MFGLFVRNIDAASRISKAAGCCALGVGTVWRCYDRIQGMNEIYALVICIFFALSLIGVALHVIEEKN
ncbi:MAG TPA: hypothetical protein VFE58_03895 [Tepidisphaeraceae bacterium]|nr:hypothetical protein [Tepidisphaeraceae bacterium]